MIAENKVSLVSRKNTRYRRVTCVKRSDSPAAVEITPLDLNHNHMKLAQSRVESLPNDSTTSHASTSIVSRESTSSSRVRGLSYSQSDTVIEPNEGKEKEGFEVSQEQLGQGRDDETKNSKCVSPTSRANSQKTSLSQVTEPRKDEMQDLKTRAENYSPSANTIPSSPKQRIIKRLISIKKKNTCSPPITPSNSASTTSSKLSEEKTKSTNIEQCADTVVPQVDAPKSAVNAGERRVLVRFNQWSISIAVTPETTSIDIIQSTADILKKEFTPLSSTLFESFTSLGLRRRIRKYERIRDVMNSWDRDTQNSLIIELACEKDETDLVARFASNEVPFDMTLSMYHSQKPGKWNKRYLTLLSSGQMFISKHACAKLTDKDSQNICHLSDFDIYSTISQETLNDIDPPGRKCYAIKSQQKITMFLSSENFLHYFSTVDDDIGEKFYTTVQCWRSWFLVNQLGKGNSVLKQHKTPIPGEGRSDSHTLKQDKQIPYQNSHSSCSPKPLLDTFHSKNETRDKASSSIDTLLENRQLHDSRYQINLRQYSAKSNHASSDENEEFPSSSLLGRTYSERKHQLENKERKRGETLPSNQKNSTQNQRCLLDFTSPPTEPPQWSRRGKGHGVQPVEGIPLVEIATSNFQPTYYNSGLNESSNRKRSETGPGRIGDNTQNQRCLLDFTSTPQEPRQWSRSGKGHGVRPAGGVPLVNIATSGPLKSPNIYCSITPKPGFSKRAEGPFVEGGLIAMIKNTDKRDCRKV